MDKKVAILNENIIFPDHYFTILLNFYLFEIYLYYLDVFTPWLDYSALAPIIFHFQGTSWNSPNSFHSRQEPVGTRQIVPFKSRQELVGSHQIRPIQDQNQLKLTKFFPFKVGTFGTYQIRSIQVRNHLEVTKFFPVKVGTSWNTPNLFHLRQELVGTYQIRPIQGMNHLEHHPIRHIQGRNYMEHTKFVSFKVGTSWNSPNSFHLRLEQVETH